MTRRIRIPDVPRERDDEVLRWLKRRLNGATWANAGTGSTDGPGGVHNVCRKVAEDDAQFSGEDVRRFYP